MPWRLSRCSVPDELAYMIACPHRVILERLKTVPTTAHDTNGESRGNVLAFKRPNFSQDLQANAVQSKGRLLFPSI